MQEKRVDTYLMKNHEHMQDEQGHIQYPQLRGTDRLEGKSSYIGV